MMVSCVFNPTGPSLAIITTAEELATEIAADKESAEKKYEEKSFILTGEVLRVEKPGFGMRVILKGTTDKPLICSFYTGNKTKERDKAFVPGAKIKIYGEFNRFGDFQLDKCELITLNK